MTLYIHNICPQMSAIMYMMYLYVSNCCNSTCSCSCDCCVSEEEERGSVRSEGGMGEGEDIVRAGRETYSSIQLIKIPLSKKPVKFR